MLLSLGPETHSLQQGSARNWACEDKVCATPRVQRCYAVGPGGTGGASSLGPWQRRACSRVSAVLSAPVLGDISWDC